MNQENWGAQSFAKIFIRQESPRGIIMKQLLIDISYSFTFISSIFLSLYSHKYFKRNLFNSCFPGCAVLFSGYFHIYKSTQMHFWSLLKVSVYLCLKYSSPFVWYLLNEQKCFFFGFDVISSPFAIVCQTWTILGQDRHLFCYLSLVRNIIHQLESRKARASLVHPTLNIGIQRAFMFVIDNARKRSTFRHDHDVHYPEKPYNTRI